jgi:glutathione synthase/RimK-type ligase-like ATP-grasp enzyme
LRLLAIVTAGDFMANTPVDFLLNGSDCTLILHHVTADTQRLDLPPHDVALLAIGQSDENAPVLANMARLLARHAGPVLNRDAGMIARLTRDQVSILLAGEPSILSPRTRRMRRGVLRVDRYPVILRPVGSHAGQGLGLVRTPAELALWLTENPEDEVFVAPFVDYRGAEGMYAKQRIVLIGGRPHASHMAMSRHWMVHYLNAEMTAHPERRAAEAAWMAGFDTFARRHARAFAALHRIFGIDYFGIDCAEAPDGRLLVFEVDTAMIVHDMDDAALFPHKQPAMRRLFDGFLAHAAAVRRA